MRDGRLGSAAELIATLAAAIDAAHHCGVVHRDLKPSNILLKVTGEGPSDGPLNGCVPKIADFGLCWPSRPKAA